MADDLGDEWWLNDDENDDLNSQNLKEINQSKFSMYFWFGRELYFSQYGCVYIIFFMLYCILHYTSSFKIISPCLSGRK